MPEGCELCYHRCGVSRDGRLGVCRVDRGLYVAGVYRHGGEEPVLGGDGTVCNVFFAHCNMQCVYCQNYQISDSKTLLSQWERTVADVGIAVIRILDKGCDTLGLVSPTPYVGHAVRLIEFLHDRGYRPTVVYNTNGYDTVEALRRVGRYVDVYLPDYKYGSYELAYSLSGVRNYPDAALESIREMLRQRGGAVAYDAEGKLRSGVIVRHMVLPGHVENSRAALINLATECGSSNILLSVMAQYNPAHRSFEYPELNRRLRVEEYEEVLAFADELGFSGWAQALTSAATYNPDFTQADPFASR